MKSCNCFLALGAFSVLLIGSLIFYNVLNEKTKNNYQAFEMLLNGSRLKYNILEKQFYFFMKYNDFYLNNSICLTDSIRNKYKIKEIIKNKSFVMVIPENTCNLCNDTLLYKVVENAYKFEKNQFFIIVPSSRLREYYYFFNQRNIPNIYGIDSGLFLINELDNSLIPYCFLIDEKLKLTNLFLADARNQEIFIQYFKSISYALNVGI
ncbi:MAG: hypothetical protein JXA72_07355 [Bacteroidales bacterium]|nr:hypothetical protein [Bacteroidales bacterium]